MRFLVDASLPRSTAAVINEYGHDALDVRDLGLASAPDSLIAEHAEKAALTIISADFDFGDIRRFPPEAYQGIVIINRPEDATIAQVLELIRSILTREDILRCLAGRPLWPRAVFV
jgi:predicted nuclease of predicted toxin-antitoxin system